MAYNQAFQHPTEDLFLDILTKEEREALLSKKMEEIRKKNELLRKRHEEIEADKRQAEKLAKPVGSPKKEIKPLPGEEKPVRPRGRGRPQMPRPLKDNPPLKSQGRGSILRRKQRAPEERGSQRIPATGHMYADRLSDDEPPPENFRDRRHNHPAQFDGNDFYNDRLPRDQHSVVYSRQNSNPKDSERQFRNKQPPEEFRNKVSQTPQNEPAYSGRLADSESGPPPDPSFNFLADRSREGQGDSVRDKEMSRRHHKNFGGTEFQNVKMKMKMQKHDRGHRGPPSSPMEMTMSMTGRERRQYTEWKAERDKVDQQRIDRQKSASGEWKRAWDAEKLEGDFDESMSHRSEPGRRPGTLGEHLTPEHAASLTGRIGSGRFVHSERTEERQRGEAPGPRGVGEKRPSTAHVDDV